MRYFPYKDEFIKQGEPPISNVLFQTGTVETEIPEEYDIFRWIKLFGISIFLFFIVVFFIRGILLFRSADVIEDKLPVELSTFSSYEFLTTDRNYSESIYNYFIHKTTMDPELTEKCTTFAPQLLLDIEEILKSGLCFKSDRFCLFMDDNWYKSQKMIHDGLVKLDRMENFNWSGFTIALCGTHFRKEQIKDYNEWLDKGVRFYNHTRDHFSIFDEEEKVYHRIEKPDIDFIISDFSKGYDNLKRIFGSKFKLVKDGDFFVPYLESGSHSFVVNLVIPYGEIPAWQRAYIFRNGILYDGKYLMPERIYRARGGFEGERSRRAIGDDRIEYSPGMFKNRDGEILLKRSSGLFTRVKKQSD